MSGCVSDIHNDPPTSRLPALFFELHTYASPMRMSQNNVSIVGSLDANVSGFGDSTTHCVAATTLAAIDGC